MKMEALNESIAIDLLNKYKDDYGDFELWRRNIVDFFSLHPKMQGHVHSVKSRLKDPDHLREKIYRKWADDDPITEDNLYEKITDLAGVRVLLLHQEKFVEIKKAIDLRVSKSEWHLVENPKAYTWDPEAKLFFESLGYPVHTKESFYTSVHYVIRQHAESEICCEIQIRTLFEEIWGEVDHEINYPEKTTNNHCRDQILVLAKLIGAGSRLVDSIFSSNFSNK
ncbi:RelA/SpoT domain-containing protein [Alcaligenes faecalis subsp. faecalis]|uniref:RelA/SpoT domain-containing protein n=1 Tax=Alcaligenes faecalis TaxID=511 RepID=UPI001F42E45A|nr:RelA/SpoT domain-containing protein [Alcaligenes faecalis]MBW4787099.1 RelA/SpoT domain-containing protein [Alcaligenes faecalis subsp. faecalis]